MIKKIEIENYKSLENLSMELGRFNVLIGENGCGKTNILESLVFAAAGSFDQVENGFIGLRGGRPSEPKFYRSGFVEENVSKEIRVTIFDSEANKAAYEFRNENLPFSKWEGKFTFNNDDQDVKTFSEDFITSLFINEKDSFKDFVDVNLQTKKFKIKKGTNAEEFDSLLFSIIKKKNYFATFSKFKTLFDSFQISNYITYAPENFFLRNSNIIEPFIEPVGYRGEGLLKLIKVIKKEKPDEYVEIVSHLDLIDWFDNFEVNEDFSADSEFTLSDKYLEDGLKSFDIRNANEGFLFVLFYLTIFISDYTPKFFAIDNIDTALNPKLCSKLISVLAELAKKHDKQVIITTHNPSVLDGLNLNDDEERLFVIARNKSGRTRATRIEKKPAVNGTAPVKLSEQFLRGYIGGLPKNF